MTQLSDLEPWRVAIGHRGCALCPVADESAKAPAKASSSCAGSTVLPAQDDEEAFAGVAGVG